MIHSSDAKLQVLKTLVISGWLIFYLLTFLRKNLVDDDEFFNVSLKVIRGHKIWGSLISLICQTT